MAPRSDARGLRRRHHLAESLEEGLEPEVVHRAPEEHRRELARLEAIPVEAVPGGIEELGVVAELVVARVVDRLADRGVVDAGHLHRRALRPGGGARPGVLLAEQVHASADPVVDAAEGPAAEDGPGDGVDPDPEHALHLPDEVEGVPARPIHLVHEGEDRDGTLAADPEELAGLGLHALGAVEQHHRAVDRMQRTVGVLAEVGVAGRVEEVHLQAPVGKLQHAGGDGDASLALHLHPVAHRAGAPALGLDGAGELDDPPVQQKLLRERGLPGVRVRDDGERPSPGDLVSHALAGCSGPPTRALFGFQNCRGSMQSAMSANWTPMKAASA